MLREDRNLHTRRGVHAHNRHPERWSSDTERGTEHQVIRLLAALVVMLQPDRVLETGTFQGDATLAMARELARMPHQPTITTVELDDSLAEQAVARLDGLPVTVVNADADTWTPPEGTLFDFAFFDTDGKKRLAQQAERYLPWMRRHAWFAVHDTGTQWPTQQQLDRMSERGLIRCVRAPTPRGVTLCEVL